MPGVSFITRAEIYIVTRNGQGSRESNSKEHSMNKGVDAAPQGQEKEMMIEHRIIMYSEWSESPQCTPPHPSLEKNGSKWDSAWVGDNAVLVNNRKEGQFETIDGNPTWAVWHCDLKGFRMALEIYSVAEVHNREAVGNVERHWCVGRCSLQWRDDQGQKCEAGVVSCERWGWNPERWEVGIWRAWGFSHMVPDGRGELGAEVGGQVLQDTLLWHPVQEQGLGAVCGRCGLEWYCFRPSGESVNDNHFCFSDSEQCRHVFFSELWYFLSGLWHHYLDRVVFIIRRLISRWAFSDVDYPHSVSVARGCTQVLSILSSRFRP